MTTPTIRRRDSAATGTGTTTTATATTGTRTRTANRTGTAMLALACAILASPALGANESLALKPGDEYLMVANYPANLNVIDLATASVYKTCPVPGKFGPGLTQISPDRRTGYILSDRFGAVYGIDLDTCKVTFKAEMSLAPGERAKSIMSFTVSADGKEVYAVQNPTTLERDRYRVGEPRFAVYDAAAGVDARPSRVFPVPRQTNIMQAADDGSVYLAGPNLYQVDVKAGTFRTALPIRDWKRDGYAPVDVLYFWPVQTPTRDFTILYTTARLADGNPDPAAATPEYGFLNVNLKSGKTDAREFGPLTELYFTGLRSPKDPNIIYGLLHRLAKYDIADQKLIQAAELEHTYYTLLGNRDGSRLYLTGTLNDIAIYDADSLKRLGNIVLPGGDMGAGTGQVFVR